MAATILGLGLLAPVQAQHREVKLHHVRDIGTLDGPLAFGAIGPLAATDSLLAIYEGTDCRIILYHLKKGIPVGSWGGCGGGPGEFNRVTAMDWIGDSLFVADARGLMIHVFDQTGRAVRTFHPEVKPFALQIVQLGQVNDTTIALGLGLGPSIPTLGNNGTEANSFVAVVSTRTGRVLRRFLPDVDPRSHSNRMAFGRALATCFTKSPSRSTVFATLGPLSFQGSIGVLYPVFQVRSEFNVAVRSLEPEDRGGGQWQATGVRSIACARQATILKVSRQDADRSRATGYIEVRDYQGKVLLAQRLTWSDSTLFGFIAAAAGDRVFLRTNRIFEFPVVSEYRLEFVGSVPMKP